jgi:hypothetical protein
LLSDPVEENQRQCYNLVAQPGGRTCCELTECPQRLLDMKTTLRSAEPQDLWLPMSFVTVPILVEISSVPNVREFGKYMDVTVPRGKIHNYLGIQFDFMQKGKVVVMTMDNYIQELLKEVPDDLFKGTAVSPAGNYLFNVNPSCKKLDNETAVIYHHLHHR